MIQRIYVHNFRCFENFSIDLAERRSILLIGKNGTGKSTLRKVLEIIQRICRGTNRLRDLIEAGDFTQQRTHVPIRFEVDITLSGKRFQYLLSFELPEFFREVRVAEEKLTVDGQEIYSRQQAEVSLPTGSKFRLDWHVVALPLINERPSEKSLRQLKTYFASMILIAPVPTSMTGYSQEESMELEADASNFSSWLNALLARYPAAYNSIYSYLRLVLPDLESFENVLRGESGKQLIVKFEHPDSNQTLSLDFGQLSDGEKCFFLSALIVASNKINEPIFCMWDEPDNHLSLSEVGHFLTQLRKMTHQRGQLIVTSHHPETIRQFSDETTLVFTRKSHLEPTMVRTLSEIGYHGDLIESLMRDEVVG